MTEDAGLITALFFFFFYSRQQFPPFIPPLTDPSSSGAKTFSDVFLTCHLEHQPPRCPSAEPLQSALPAVPAVETSEKLHLQLHLKPLIRYHEHQYRDNATCEHQTDGTGETVRHFPHDPSEACHIDIQPKLFILKNWKHDFANSVSQLATSMSMSMNTCASPAMTNLKGY